MSIESSQPLRVGVTAVSPLPVESPSTGGAVDHLLAPVDHLHDRLVGGLATLGRSAEAGATKRSPVLGMAAQFAVGALSAVATMAEGTWQTIRHPLRTLEGLWALAGHVPLTPMWLWRLVTEGPTKTLGEDKAFFGAVVQGFLAPYRQDWQAGRYFAVAGRAAVDIGTIYVGFKQAKTAVDRWRAQRAAQTAEVGLVDTVMGTQTRASGQVLGEGTLVVKRPARPRYKAQARTLAIKKLKHDQAVFNKIRQVGPERLAKDGRIQSHYRRLTHSVDARMDQELAKLLGFEPKGLPKDPVRAAAKLELWRASDGGKARLGALDDLARGRIDLPGFDPAQMRNMLQSIRRHFGDDNLIISDYIKGKPAYKGRLHVKIRDGSGLWYELQMGPKQLSQFYDTSFSAAGRVTNVHDAIYKGLFRLDDAAVKVLGKGNLDVGAARVAKVLDAYVAEVDEVMAVARGNASYLFRPQTTVLRRAIADLLDELPDHLLPVGLR